jgi:hypothetical protein
VSVERVVRAIARVIDRAHVDVLDERALLGVRQAQCAAPTLEVEAIVERDSLQGIGQGWVRGNTREYLAGWASAARHPEVARACCPSPTQLATPRAQHNTKQNRRTQ